MTPRKSGKAKESKTAPGEIHSEDRRETDLLKTEVLQRAIFNSANFSSIATDAKGVIQIFNVGAERLLGYTAAEVMNKMTPADLSDPQELTARAKLLSDEVGTPITPGFEALVFKASHGIEDIYELTYIRKDGSRFPAVVSVTALRDAQDAIIGYLLIGTDNTARKEAQLKAGALQRAIFNSANFSSIATDAKGVIQIFNVGAERLLGYTAAEVVNKITPADLSDPRDLIARAKSLSVELGTPITPGFEALVFKASRGIEDIYELTYIRKDGSRFPAVVSITALPDAQDAVIGYLLIGTDNTERKQAVEALRESERKYRLLVANAHEAIFIAQDNIVKFPNPKALEMTGYSTEELAGVPFTDLIHPEDRGTVLERYIDRLRGELSPETYSFRVMKKTGEEIWVQLTANRIDWEGRPGVLCFLRDITKERNQDAQLQQAMKMEAVGTLAGGIAHDFNNALTGIVGFGELLRMRMAGDEQALHDLDEIQRCAERASTLTRQLLTFARRQVIEPVNLNLSTLVADLMKLIGKVVGEHIEVKTTLGKNIPTIHADRGQIEQVVMNLCLNSRDAMPEGGRLVVETGDVSLDEEYVRQNPYMKTGRYALLTVSDTGIGMDEKTRERVFEPFFTTKGPDKGTGLGLSMVYGIVKQHGGFIHLYSEPGKGTAFKVYFPAIEAQPDAVPAIRREEIVRGGTETILLAEDEEAILPFIERAMKELGYTVLVARNGEEAIEIFRQHKEIVLAVLDVVMPRKGGKEAFDEMHKQNPRLKVIFMSGYSSDAIHDSFVLIPGTPFLQKPFGPTILARKVREVLDTQ